MTISVVICKMSGDIRKYLAFYIRVKHFKLIKYRLFCDSIFKTEYKHAKEGENSLF